MLISLSHFNEITKWFFFNSFLSKRLSDFTLLMKHLLINAVRYIHVNGAKVYAFEL